MRSSRLWRVVALPLVLGPLLVALTGPGVYAAPLVPAVHLDTDPCGSEPSIFDSFGVTWATWEACEISNGTGTAPITNVVDPLMGQVVYWLQSVDNDLAGVVSAVNGVASSVVSGLGSDFSALGSDISGLSSALGTDLSNLGSSISGYISTGVSAVTAFFLPGSSDVTVVENAWTTVSTGYEPFHTITLLAHEISLVQAGYANASGGSYSGGPGVPGAGDYGAVSGGVSMWLSFMSNIGMSQSTVKALIDWSLGLAALMSMAHDFGVRWLRA